MSRPVMSKLISVNLPDECLPKCKLKFSSAEKTVKLPLKAYGKVAHPGWDIPTWWAIDADNQCWMDNAHGRPLFPVTVDLCCNSMERQADRNLVKRTLGLPEEQPEWMTQALAAGWGPKILGHPSLNVVYDARIDARIIAHAYITDQKPPEVEDALTRVLEDERSSKKEQS